MTSTPSSTSNNLVIANFGTTSVTTQADKDNIVIEYRNKARKLAKSILKKWRSRLDLDEINSVVDLSLCEAVKRFDPTRGTSFITFLFYHLRGNLIRTVTAAANANIIPGVTANTPNDASFNANDIASALSNCEDVSPHEKLFHRELIRITFEACDKLDDLERQVVQRIFLDEEPLNDVAASLGYSRCHISRVKKRAIEILNSEMVQTVKTSLGIGKNSVLNAVKSNLQKVQRRKNKGTFSEELKRKIVINA